MEAPVEQLKRLARHPLKIMDDLLAAAAAVAAAPDLPWEEKAERLRAKQEACLQEMEATYAAFRRAAAFVQGDGLQQSLTSP